MIPRREAAAAIYGLDLLRQIAMVHQVEYRPCLGRGFEAWAIKQALRQHFERKHGQGP
ncbi:MAG: hypothetical protein WD042_02925 [Phycisphaeraceae bacterium]